MKNILYPNTKKEVSYFSIYDNHAVLSFQEHLKKVFENLSEHQSLIFLCIGSDRATGDCLGPLVGQYLIEKISKELPSQTTGFPRKKAAVFGTLQNPVHAGNLEKTLFQIQNRFCHPFIIAIDASLGIQEHIGYVTFAKGHLRPGSGVRHLLPEIGDFHITGIVNQSTKNNQLTLQTTNLLLVINLAQFISTGILQALHVCSSL